MVVKLRSTAPAFVELLGTTNLLAQKGIVYFTDLAITMVGTYWLEFVASQHSLSVSCLAFEVVHGRASSVGWVEQPTTTSVGAVFVPQPLAQVWDQYGNIVMLPYPFKARVFAKRRDVIGTPPSFITHGTHVSCKQCGGFFESHNFFSDKGYIRFKDLSVVLSPDGPTNEFGLRLELMAVNLTLCERIGDDLLCDQKTEYIHDRQVFGLSEYFNIFTIAHLQITAQPADTNASLIILGQKGGNDLYPRVELYGESFDVFFRKNLFHAPVKSFDLEVTLYYADSAAGAHCLQVNSSQSCLGVCESNNALCDRKCPKDLGSTGRQFTEFNGDPDKYTDDLNEFVHFYKGIEVHTEVEKYVCAYQTICHGVMGNATCPNLRINRAGTYRLLFRSPACGLIEGVPWVKQRA